MYGNGLPYPYNQPYYNYGNYGFKQVPMPANPWEERTIKRVHGREGALAFKMDPDSSRLLLDDTDPILWVKTTDSAGYPTVTPYDISPHVENREIVQPEYDFKSLEERISKLERRLNNNGKSSFGGTRPNQPTETAAKQ